MFAMERAEFPVDTHVWHITKKLGWVPATCSRESCYEHLNARVPDTFKFALHVLLVDHGKLCKACSKGGGGGKSGKNDEVRVVPSTLTPITSQCFHIRMAEKFLFPPKRLSKSPSSVKNQKINDLKF